MFYTDVNGNQFFSYEDACHYYGADTPAQLEAEAAYYEAEELAQREMNDALVYWPVAPIMLPDDDEIPF